MFNLTLNSLELNIKMIIYLFYLFFTTSVWQKFGFKRSCHTLVKILFLLSNTNMCILHYFRKPKSTSISPHNFYSTLCNKRKPLNCSIQFHLYWSCNITTVSFICFRLWHKTHSIQKPIEELKHPCAQTPKVQPVTLN